MVGFFIIYVMKIQSVDVIVPVRNEAQTIEQLVKRLDLALSRAKINYSVIIVDDHSTDKTQFLVSKLQKKYPIKYYKKIGKPGKAFSIIEGGHYATSEYVVMLDADLEYPPEVIPEMLSLTGEHGVVIAHRRTYKTGRFRHFASRLNAFLLGRVFLDLPYDIQSGLKLFRREILVHLPPSSVRAWAIDLPLLHTARELGYSIGSVNIDFVQRPHGQSKISFLQTAGQIIDSAVRLKLGKPRVFEISPHSAANMVGAGVAARRQRFITHTTLPHRRSALTTLSIWQQCVIVSIIGVLAMGLAVDVKLTAIVLVAILSTIYFIDVFFNLYLIFKSLYFPPEISVDEKELQKLDDKKLPVYSILCPLYKEAHVLPQFVRAISKLDWPKDKLEVLLLLEADDQATIAAAGHMSLPEYFRTVVVPHSHPKTKPKACNYGLAHAHGQYLVIYDAEDDPDPQQLKKAYLAFSRVSTNTICLQAKLNYYNPHHNLLTRLFTAEYSLWFDVVLPGLQSISTSIPLGGTSNHFRTRDLHKLQGWDPFNVTEDCDLGVRLFQEGYKTAIINSTTLEEANSNVKNWIRQRSRWIKGYMQTYFVHMRHPLEFVRRRGIHALIFQLVVGGKIAFMLINPVLWVLTISYFALYSLVGPTIEALYPSVVFYMAVISLVFGNFLCVYYYMIGCAKREHWSVIKYVFLVPFYWLLVSYAAAVAAIQLVTKPHYWEKTIHGLHLGQPPFVEADLPRSDNSFVNKLVDLRRVFGSGLARGGLLVAATAAGSVLNFLYNAFLGRKVPIETFGVINLFGTFFYLVSIPVGALGKTITYRSGYLSGKFGQPVYAYWSSLQRPLLVVAGVATVVWFVAMPAVAGFFHLPSVMPLLLFSPIWFVAIGVAANSGFLGGTHQFAHLAVLTVVDAVVKLAAAVVFVNVGRPELIYAVIPLAIGVEYLLGTLIISRNLHKNRRVAEQAVTYFPKRFFATSVLSILSTATFLTVDVILVNHYLSPLDAGHYGLLSLVGKMIIVAGSMFGQFVTPMVSHEIGAGRDGARVFYKLLAVITVVCLVGFLGVGVFGYITVPFLFGKDIASVVGELPVYTLAMVLFTISTGIVSFHQIRREYIFPVVGFLLAIAQITGLIVFHGNLSQVVTVMFVSAVLQLMVMVLLHIFQEQVRALILNTLDFFGLFGRISTPVLPSRKLRILIFNWRDTRHAWAGGAEVYIHEMAKRWVKNGHSVTVFCGNDGKNPRNQVVDGMQVVRRGGFYTVYIWAFLYYILRFRGLFDVVIDSENGVPFFTPLYVRVPTFLLIHHVHQAIFRERLKFPLSSIALFAESRMMPLLYKKSQVITVSESSKSDIIAHRLAKIENILVINPGIDNDAFTLQEKTPDPTFLYLGRLKAYKNIDVAIQAFRQVHRKHPKSRLVIAGEGEHYAVLSELVSQLKLKKSVLFAGKVSERKKVELFATSWIAVQPSSHEGWGISVIEANACGTTVIASAINGLKDSVVDDKTGILVPPKNVHALARSMELLIVNHQLRLGLSAEAYEWSKSFSWERSAEEFLDRIFSTLHDRERSVISERSMYLAKA